MTCVTLELKSQEKKEIEYEQQKKSLMEDIHFNIIFKRIYIRRWLRDREFDEEEIDLVIFAAKEYSKENASDRTSMMYSRTFLENEIYLDYQDKFKKYKVYLKEQEELDEIRKKLKMKDGYE